MNLFFLRHGKAHPRGPRWRPDRKRPLTREGENNMLDVARGLQAMEVAFDAILTSPFARARRTAEILARVYRSRKIFETGRLAPDAGGKEIVDKINQNFRDARGIVLVGHEPDMSRLISILLTGAGGMEMELKKAGICKLSVEKLVFGQCACLHWFLTPKQLAQMRRVS
jgi:phosphohistidine phosphatase